ncbi:MAG TPA: hypothetical protein VG826_33270 [Pirellulales bacterium]|nr:hypothetical protein [Pirellulales bacterium]
MHAVSSPFPKDRLIAASEATQRRVRRFGRSGKRTPQPASELPPAENLGELRKMTNPETPAFLAPLKKFPFRGFCAHLSPELRAVIR